MNKDQIENFKAKLEAEKATLEEELRSVGRRNPDNPADWEARPEDQDISSADENELADKFEEYDGNMAILEPLERRYNEVKKALNKIETGEGYGICEVSGEQIEIDRLEANPAATTCKKHMETGQ